MCFGGRCRRWKASTVPARRPVSSAASSASTQLDFLCDRAPAKSTPYLATRPAMTRPSASARAESLPLGPPGPPDAVRMGSSPFNTKLSSTHPQHRGGGGCSPGCWQVAPSNGTSETALPKVCGCVGPQRGSLHQEHPRVSLVMGHHCSALDGNFQCYLLQMEGA